jgi:regulatory protein
MKIIELKCRKTRGDARIDLELDDGSTHALDAELAVRFHLKRGLDVDEELLARLRREQSRLEARRRLVRYLALRKKTAREAAHYLERLGFEPDAVEMAIAAARELGLLDDRRYAAAYTRTQERAASKGPRAIRAELAMRGVDKEAADRALAASEDPQVQRARARQLAMKKARALRADDARKARRKLLDFLIRKGYDPEVAAEVTRELLGEAES